MNKKDIDSIAYLIKKSKSENKPGPIVFLGAGASVSAGIPVAVSIMNDILERYKEKPELSRLKENEINYYSVMKCLNTNERHTLLRSYIRHPDVRINVTHIYLAQLLFEEYIDYILTVNFDDLILRACSLFNFLPPVYDIAIQKEFTTSNLHDKSVTYLHGLHHGFWLLNTDEELEIVKSTVTNIFNRICNDRTWIVVGYSGQDPIFDIIAKLGRFDNELYWVGYKNQEPCECVQNKLLSVRNTNAYWVPGYDSDTFFLKLHAELGLTTPVIFNKPFSFLGSHIKNIKDIEAISEISDDQKELFIQVKERYETSKKWVNDAINRYELSGQKKYLKAADIMRDKLKQEIIEASVSLNFYLADELKKKAEAIEDRRVNELLSDLYVEWGITLYYQALKTNDEQLINKRIEKYETAVELNPLNYVAWTNWGNAISQLADIKKDAELYKLSFEKYKTAIKLNPENEKPFAYWASALSEYAILTGDELLFKDVFEKFKTASTLNKNSFFVFNNWAHTVLNYVRFSSSADKQKYLLEGKSIAERARDLDGYSYNLACFNAILNNKDAALNLLDESLTKTEIGWEEVLKDPDWKILLNDEEFKKIIKKHKISSINDK